MNHIKKHIGDGIYIEWDGEDFILTNHNTKYYLSEIRIDPIVMSGLEMYVDEVARLLERNSDSNRENNESK